MKKFRTTAEHIQLPETHLRTLLADKNLLHSVFRHYIHLPLGLLVSLLMLGASRLSGRHWLAEENLLFCFQGVTAIAFFFSFQAWIAFRNHRLQLRHTLNAYVSSGLYPLLFGGLFLYLCLPLGWPSLVDGLLVTTLVLAYSAGKAPLQHMPWLRYQTLTLLILALCWLPLLAPAGQVTLEAAVFLLILGLLFFILNQIYHVLLHTRGVKYEQLVADRH